MFGAPRRYHRQVCGLEDAGWEIRDCLFWFFGSGFPKSHNNYGLEGYGTALKPAYEPIIMAMKPCDGTFKQNAEKWGQAGINIDACRIGADLIEKGNFGREKSCGEVYELGLKSSIQKSFSSGRWPANILFDEEAAKMLDEQSGESISRRARIKRPRGVLQMGGMNFRPCHGKDLVEKIEGVDDSGGASRFFYCAKTSSKERNEGLDCEQTTTDDGRLNPIDNAYQRGKTLRKNNHPTVKPLKLMRYLITLIMPPKDGILLDPFAGSGSTIVAAHQLGVKAIGIEKSAEYCEIARARLAHAQVIKTELDPQLNFLDGTHDA